MTPKLSSRPDAPPQHAATDSHAAVEGAPQHGTTRRDLGVRVAGLSLLGCAILAAGSFASRRSTEPPAVGPFHGNATTQPSSLLVAPSSPRHPKHTPMPRTAPTTRDTIVVHVAGQVKHPGVYTLPANARVQDALLKAGGALPNGDPDALNLAAHPEDGEKIVVPPKDTASGIAREVPARDTPAPETFMTPTRNRSTTHESSTTGGKSAESGADAAKSARQAEKNAQLDALRSSPVNLNTASETQLQTLPGIGPAMANRILDYRAERGRFSGVDDLDNVKGIGPKKLEQLRPFVIAR